MLVCISIVIANKNNEDSKSFKCWLLKIKTSQVLVKTFAIDFAGEVNNFRDSVLVRHSERCLSSLSTASLPVSLQERLPSSGIETRGTIRSSTGVALLVVIVGSFLDAFSLLTSIEYIISWLVQLLAFQQCGVVDAQIHLLLIKIVKLSNVD